MSEGATILNAAPLLDAPISIAGEATTRVRGVHCASADEASVDAASVDAASEAKPVSDRINDLMIASLHDAFWARRFELIKRPR